MFNRLMNLDNSLQQEIPLHENAIKFPDAYGLEIELEGVGVNNCPPEVNAYWAQHDDHSLRVLKPGATSTEYVSRMPYNIKDLEKSVELLFQFLKGPNVKVFDSYRTSIHVHVNFGTEPYRVIYNFITLSLILDELLVSQNGDHRVGNNFCLRAKDALGQVVGLINSIENGQEFSAVVHQERYSSINFASLLKFGSIEFRSLECTTHEGRLMHWVNTLGRIKEISKKFDTPVDIIQKFSALDTQAFLSFILGPYALKYLQVPGYDTMVRNGMRIAQDFAYCSAWKARDFKVKKDDVYSKTVKINWDQDE